MGNVFEQEMNSDQEKVFDELKHNFEKAYRLCVKLKALRDESMVKTGFYTIAHFIVTNDPLPDTTVQHALLEWLEQQRFAAMKNEMQTVDLLMADASRESARQRMQLP